MYSKQMSYSLTSLKGLRWGTILGVIKGDTRSLDYGSNWVRHCSEEVFWGRRDLGEDRV